MKPRFIQFTDARNETHIIPVDELRMSKDESNDTCYKIDGSMVNKAEYKRLERILRIQQEIW